MIWRLLILIIFILNSGITLKGQYMYDPLPDEPRIKDRLIIGGDFGLSFGTITYIEVLPVAGLRLTERLSFMAGPMYTYYRDGRFLPPYKTSFYGGRGLARYMVYNQFFIQGEYNLLSFESFGNSRVTKDFVLAGPGIMNGPFAFCLLFYLYQPGNTPFVSPFAMRAGLYFTL